MSEIRNLTRNGETFYPLTTSSAVINEATGEGLIIDDEPTAGSDNLVKSGGVWDTIQSISLPNGLLLSGQNKTQNELNILKCTLDFSVINNKETKKYKLQMLGKTGTSQITVIVADVEKERRYQVNFAASDFSGIKSYSVTNRILTIEFKIDWTKYFEYFTTGYYSNTSFDYSGIFVQSCVNAGDALPLVHKTLTLANGENYYLPEDPEKNVTYYLQLKSDTVVRILEGIGGSYNVAFERSLKDGLFYSSNQITGSLVISNQSGESLSGEFLCLKEGTLAYEMLMKDYIDNLINTYYDKTQCTITNKILRYSDGAVVDTTNSSVSDYININKAIKVKASNLWPAGQTSYSPVVIYDKNREFVTRLQADGEIDLSNYPTAFYIRFCYVDYFEPTIEIIYDTSLSNIKEKSDDNKEDVSSLSMVIGNKTNSIGYISSTIAEYYRQTYAIYNNPALDDYKIKSIEIGVQLSDSNYRPTIGDTITIYIGTVLQVHDMPQYQDGQYLFISPKSYVITLSEDNFKINAGKRTMVIELKDKSILLKKGECIGFHSSSPHILISRSSTQENNMLRGTDIADAFDPFYDFCYLDIQLESCGNTFAQKYEVKEIDENILDINQKLSVSDIIYDRTTGLPYKIIVNNGVIGLQSLSISKLFVYGASQVLHGYSPILNYYRKGGMSMVPSIADNAFINLADNVLNTIGNNANVQAKQCAPWETTLYTVNRDQNTNAIIGYTKTVHDFATMFADVTEADTVFMFLLGNTSMVYDSDSTKAMLIQLIKEQCITLFEYLHSKFPNIDMYANVVIDSEKMNIVKDACNSLNYMHYVDLGSLWSNNNWQLGDWYAEEGINTDLIAIAHGGVAGHANDVWDYESLKAMLLPYYNIDNHFSRHNIILNNVSGGTISTPFNKSVSPAIINIRCMADNEKYVTSLTIKKSDGTDVTSNVGLKLHVNDYGVQYTFKMPDYDVVITPTWGTTREYIPRNITVASVTGGYAQVYSNILLAGEKVMVYLVADSGHNENGISLSASGISVLSEGSGVYSFTMPNSDITIIPQFT